MWVADCLEEPGRSWYTGSIARKSLVEDPRLGLAYYSAAVRVFPALRSEDLRQSLVCQAQKRRQCRNGDPAQGVDKTPQEGAEESTPCGTARAAKLVFLLCDRYVLHKDRGLHDMFMGRYYVLAVLFSNLGLSGILLGVCLLLSQWCLHPMPAAIGGLACAVSGGLMLARSMYFRKRFIECTFPIFYAIVQAEDSPKPAKA